MAYGLKYELLCTSKVEANEYSLSLLFDEYTGAEIERNMPANSPIVFRKDAEAVIRGTSVEFAIREQDDWEFDEFYTNNPKKIKVELYKESSLMWTGYVLPQQYQAPYIPVPVNVRFTATDGLGLLKYESFGLEGVVSQMAIIVYCIDKIGLNLGYSIAINLFEITHTTSRSPLEQTYENADNYIGKNCYEVLELILGKYDAEITQAGGLWRITASDCKESWRMLYNYTGVWGDIVPSPVVLSMGYKSKGGEVYPVGSLMRSLVPGGKKVTLKQDYGRKKSLLSNYDFTQWDGDDFASWERVGPAFTITQGVNEGKSCCFIGGYSASILQRIVQTFDIEESPGDAFVFEIDFAPIGHTYNVSTYSNYRPASMGVRMAVILVVGNDSYYLTKDSWSETYSYIEEVVTAGIKSPVWNHHKIITNGIPASGTLHVSLCRFYLGYPSHPGEVYSGIWYSEPQIYFMQDGQLYPSALEMAANFDDSLEPADLRDNVVFVADVPDLPNAERLYTKATLRSDNTITTLWYRLEEEIEYTLITHLARLLASRNRIARQKLTGTVRAPLIGPESIISHSYNGDRKFEIAEMSWDLYNETIDVTLLELLSWSSEEITFVTETSTSAGGSSTTGGVVIGTVGGNDAGQTVSSLAFQTPDFDEPINLDASIYKNFKPGIAFDNTVINVLNASDGDVGMIELLIDETGGYTIVMGVMFTKRIGSAEIDTTANADNFIIWRKILDDYVYEVLGGIYTSGEAVLELTGIAPVAIDTSANAVFDVDYSIENTGTAPGTGIVDWKITDSGDTVSEGSFRCAVVSTSYALEDTISLLAPPEVAEYVLWLKLRTDLAWTYSSPLAVGYPLLIDSIDAIPNGACYSLMNVALNVINNSVSPLSVTFSYEIIGEMALASGQFSCEDIPSGESVVNVTLRYPTPYEDIYLSVVPLDTNLNPVVSNIFTSVEVTLFPSENLISSQGLNTVFDVEFYADAADDCQMVLCKRVRNSPHREVWYGTEIISLVYGEHLYTAAISLPYPQVRTGEDNDVQITRDIADWEITYNHFEIIDD